VTTRHDTADSSLSVLQRPPVQRNLGSGKVIPAHFEPQPSPLVEISDEAPVDETLDLDDEQLSPELLDDELPDDELHVDELLDDNGLIEDATTGPGAHGTMTQVSQVDQVSDVDQVGHVDQVSQVSQQIEADPEETAPQVDPRLIALAEMTSADPRHGALRRTVIEAHLPLVHHLAQRFRGRGEPYDDLVQVGTIGLLHAVDRYNPSRGSFAAFAVPTIVGEIRRHFRDRGWALRIPRRVQDLGRRVSEARETLTHSLDRSPTVHELAAHLQVDADLVLEALETASAYITVPLPITADESDRMTKAFEDSALELVEQRATLRPLLAQLPARQQRILELRFARGMSQSQIAAEIGVSQMHVSRLLAKSLAALRSELTEEL
jgi:RNA polymerase sigma-B factor